MMIVTELQRAMLSRLSSGEVIENPTEEEKAVLDELLALGMVEPLEVALSEPLSWLLIDYGMPGDETPLCRHVIPQNDVRRHVVDETGGCWCGPSLDEETHPDAPTWVHDSADGRELTPSEGGGKKLH